LGPRGARVVNLGTDRSEKRPNHQKLNMRGGKNQTNQEGWEKSFPEEPRKKSERLLVRRTSTTREMRGI